jgi:hypothetical protein
MDKTLGASTILACQPAMEDAGVTPNQMDGILCCPEPTAEASGGSVWHHVKRGEACAFHAGDITIGGPHPFNSSAGNLGNGRTRTAVWTDCTEQLRGTTGPRQVKVRAETAVAGFGPPLGSSWIMFGKYPN